MWYLGSACTPSDGSDACTSFDTELAVWLLDGSPLTKSDLRARIVEAFQRFSNLLALQDSNISGLSISESDIIDQTDNTNQVVQERSVASDDDVSAGVWVGVAAGCLAVVLLLLLLVRRRQASDEVSHLKLEEDEDDETYLKDLASADSSLKDYQTRNVHVVGEENSIVSGWTGYTPEDPAESSGKLDHAHGDVHVCASATCEVCEQRRRQGLQFVPTAGTATAGAGASLLPSDASRDYVAEDTVEL